MDNQSPLVVVELETLVVMPQEISNHVDHESETAHKVDDGGNDGVPKTLRVYFDRRNRSVEHVHPHDDGDELAR